MEQHRLRIWQRVWPANLPWNLTDVKVMDMICVVKQLRPPCTCLNLSNCWCLASIMPKSNNSQPFALTSQSHSSWLIADYLHILNHDPWIHSLTFWVCRCKFLLIFGQNLRELHWHNFVRTACFHHRNFGSISCEVHLTSHINFAWTLHQLHTNFASTCTNFMLISYKV